MEFFNDKIKPEVKSAKWNQKNESFSHSSKNEKIQWNFFMIKLNRRSSQQNGIRRMNHSHMHESDFSADKNIDHIEKDEPSSYEKPSSLVEPLIYVFDMNLPIGIPL